MSGWQYANDWYTEREVTPLDAVLIRLSARADTAYDETYNHKLRGRLWQALDKTKFSDSHDEDTPSEFCYSNPFPSGDMAEGERRTLLVSSLHEELFA